MPWVALERPPCPSGGKPVFEGFGVARRIVSAVMINAGERPEMSNAPESLVSNPESGTCPCRPHPDDAVASLEIDLTDEVAELEAPYTPPAGS